MRRRELITLLGSTAVAWPLAARAQQPAMPVVGYVGAQSRSFYDDRLRAFHEGLGEIGFREGRDVSFEYRWAEGHVDRLPKLLSDLVARRVDLIALPDSIAGSTAAKRMFSTIPIVFGISADPVQLGLVNSWNRPGGNLTGMVLGNTELVPKRMELLHQLVPMVNTVGLLVNPDSSGAADTKLGQEAARNLGLELRILNVTNESDIPKAIERLAAEQRRALLVGSDTLFYVHRERIARLAVQHALVAIYDRREYVRAGGLISYGANLLAFHRQIGVYVGRILKGEKPADLPVMLPTKFEMAINLKTAKTLGLSVPQSMLVTADEVIE
jgi:putative tryptophan/tyrosine transport system substrate-binding protein